MGRKPLCSTRITQFKSIAEDASLVEAPVLVGLVNVSFHFERRSCRLSEPARVDARPA